MSFTDCFKKVKLDLKKLFGLLYHLDQPRIIPDIDILRI